MRDTKDKAVAELVKCQDMKGSEWFDIKVFDRTLKHGAQLYLHPVSADEQIAKEVDEEMMIYQLRQVDGAYRDAPKSKFDAISPDYRRIVYTHPITFMTPNSADSRASPDYVRELVQRIGKPQRWIADRVGISERHLRYLIAGSRKVDDKIVDVKLSYPEQFALECLSLGDNQGVT